MKHTPSQLVPLSSAPPFLLLGTMAAIAWLASCVNETPVENKSCPCANGYVCCSCTNTCVPAGQTCCNSTDAAADSSFGGEAGSDEDAYSMPFKSPTGHWEGVGTRAGAPGPVTSVKINISADLLEVETGDAAFRAARTGDSIDIALMQAGNTFHSAARRNTPATANLGVIPFDLGGGWSLASQENPNRTCSGSFDPSVGSVKAQCQGYDGPKWLSGLSAGEFGCVRNSRAQSKFGNLGGNWACTGRWGATCDVIFASDRFFASCKDAGHASGTMEVVVGDDVVSGHTSEGMEFSASRVTEGS